MATKKRKKIRNQITVIKVDSVTDSRSGWLKECEGTYLMELADYDVAIRLPNHPTKELVRACNIIISEKTGDDDAAMSALFYVAAYFKIDPYVGSKEKLELIDLDDTDGMLHSVEVEPADNPPKYIPKTEPEAFNPMNVI